MGKEERKGEGTRKMKMGVRGVKGEEENEDVNTKGKK